MSISDALSAYPTDVSQHLPLPLPLPNPSKRNRASVEGDSQESPIKTPRTPETSSPTKASPGKHTTLTPKVAETILSPRKSDSIKSRRSLLFSTTQEIDALIGEITPSLQEKVAASKAVLQKSQDDLLSIDKRVALLPKRAALDSASGSYICASEEQIPLLIVKPALQESGARFSPTGKDQTKAGINPGESVMRELLAWLVQKHLRINFGVPPVCLTTMKHLFFGDLKMVGDCLRQAQKKGIDLSYETLFALINTHSNPESFAHAILRAKLQNQLSEISARKVPQDALDRLEQFCRSMKNAQMVEFRKALDVHFANALWLGDARPKIIQLWDQIGKLSAAEAPLKDLYTALKDRQGREEAIVSAHQFEGNDGSLQKLLPREHKHIPQEEFYKFILDIVLFNTDRHLDNVLVKKEWISPDKYIYRLILIDHGYCLPRPMIQQNFEGIKQAEFEFLTFTQASCKIEGRIKDILLQLDVAAFINALKIDLLRHSSHFPTLGKALTEECFLLLEFNLRLLQRGISVGATLSEMATFQLSPDPDDSSAEEDSDMVACFKKVLLTDSNGSYSFDYNLLNIELEQRFKMKSQT